jgi:Carboxypeptidase regulatory-like domain
MTRHTKQSTMMFAVATLAFSCVAAACADSSMMAPSPTSKPSPSAPIEISTLSGHVTDRASKPAGIVGATVTVHNGLIVALSAVTDEAGFYSIPGIKLAYVTVSVTADHFVDRSESLEVENKTTRLDFQMMTASEN